jgi:hypothetical protein
MLLNNILEKAVTFQLKTFFVWNVNVGINLTSRAIIAVFSQLLSPFLIIKRNLLSIILASPFAIQYDLHPNKQY